jgi:hypothetical protein
MFPRICKLNYIEKKIRKILIPVNLYSSNILMFVFIIVYCECKTVCKNVLFDQN